MLVEHWAGEERLTGGKPVVSASEAIGRLEGPGHFFIGSGAAAPHALLAELCAQSERLKGSVLHHIILLADGAFADPRFTEDFRHQVYFCGPHERAMLKAGCAEAVPMHFHQLGPALRSGRIPLDAALIQVSLPDEAGRFSYGTAVDFVKSAVESGTLVLAEVNPQQPYVFGDAHLTADQVACFVAVDQVLQEAHHGPPDAVAEAIGRQVASLIEDGDTLQIGFGMLPDAVAGALKGHRDLGLHTEMFSDGTLALIEAGAITGARKSLHPGKHVGAFVLGSKRLYQAVDRNPAYEFHAVEYVNHPLVIGQNDRLAAINAAIAIDLTGQVCADSLGASIYSGVGGQADFKRGAALSQGGKPIIALRSTAKGGSVSRIVPQLPAGSGVTTTRFDVRFVVTEHGIADLQGKSYRERAKALIGIAEPSIRSWLAILADAS